MGNMLDKVGLIELLDGEIDANEEGSISAIKVLPGFCLPACGLQYGLTNRQYLSALLSHGNEIARRNYAKLRVSPTDESLKANQCPALERNDWLVINKQLVALRCMP